MKKKEKKKEYGMAHTHTRMCSLRYYLAASGGQSGWFDGCAARNAGWLSNSRSIRKMIGYGRKSTWNLSNGNHLLVTVYMWSSNTLTFVRWKLAAPNNSRPSIFRRRRKIYRPMLTAISRRHENLAWSNAVPIPSSSLRRHESTR